MILPLNSNCVVASSQMVASKVETRSEKKGIGLELTSSWRIIALIKTKVKLEPYFTPFLFCSHS